MKTKSILFSLLLAASAFAFLASCSGNKKEDAAAESHEGHDQSEHASGSTAAGEAGEPQFEVDGKFQEQLAGVFTSYVEVKAEATETKEALSKVDMRLISGAAHNDWMNYLTPIESSLKEIESASDIEAQRKSFSTLSDNMYKSVKAFGLGGKQAFYEYCPMAFNNEGAYWLSDQEQIRNPYFGDKMLTCGEVKEKLK
jgi:hypothetical protein